MRSLFLAMIVWGALAGSASATDPGIVAAEAAVRSNLKDPGSANFSDAVRAMRPNVRGEPTDTVCGFVNAKNSFGGYTGKVGYLYFVSSGQVYLAEAGGPGDIGALAYLNICGR